MEGLGNLIHIKHNLISTFSPIFLFNHIALRTDKILWSFGCSECNRVNNGSDTKEQDFFFNSFIHGFNHSFIISIAYWRKKYIRES